jgi:L-alanine-DL-glutamate epimerase-like enolase superfamily enzyme
VRCAFSSLYCSVGAIQPLQAYDSSGILDPRTDLPWLEAPLASGFRAIKIKLGAGDVESDVAIVAEACRTIGNGVRLMLRSDAPAAMAVAIPCGSALRLRVMSRTDRGSKPSV